METKETPSFADLLRRHRAALGLSQEALAERAGLSARGIGDLERAVKTRPHASTVLQLADALQLSPDDRLLFERAARTATVAAPDHESLPAGPSSGEGRSRSNAVAIRARWGLIAAAAALVAIVLPGHLLAGSTLSRSGVTCTPARIDTGTYMDAAVRAGFDRAVTRLHLNAPLSYHAPLGGGTTQLRQAAQHHPCVVVVMADLSPNVLESAAERYPHVRFALVDAITRNDANFVSRPNVENLVFRRQEAGYLVGYLAGLMERMRVSRAKHGVIGVMGGIPEAGVNPYIDGYRQGARAAYPGLKAILVDYAGTFIDRERGRRVGLRQIRHGADILFAVAGPAGLGYMSAAREHGVYAIGVDVDQSSLGSFVLTSALLREDTAVYDVVRDATRQRFAGGIRTFGVAQNGIGIGKTSSIVPSSIVKMVATEATKIARGHIRVRS
jgi:basic membrane protein A and related proteins